MQTRSCLVTITHLSFYHHALEWKTGSAELSLNKA